MTILCFVIVNRPLCKILEYRTILTIVSTHVVDIVHRDVLNTFKSFETQVLIIARCSPLVFTQFQIDITQHDIERDEALAGVDEFFLTSPVQSTYRARCLVEGWHSDLLVAIAGLEGFKHLCLALQDTLIAGHRGIGIDLTDSGHRLSDVRYSTILTSELQVGPCTERRDGGIFVADHVASTRGERGITMGQIVITVIDDLVIQVHTIVLVGGISRERCQITQVEGGFVSGRHQVTAHLVLEVILISQLLHSLHDAVSIEDRVSLLVEGRIEQLT